MATNYNSKVQWEAKEFTPNNKQTGMTHSWYAIAHIANTVSNRQLADLVQARTGLRAYEVKATIEALCEIIYEECLQSMRVYLTDQREDKFISIEPKVSGSISDTQVQADSEKYNNAQVATEAMLSDLPKSVSLGATVGVNASKKFALNASLEKYIPSASAAVEGDGENGGANEESTNGNQGGTTPTTNGENQEP